ncbi:hypothetical protein FO519_001952 [Halicephalobus sp. NKZ332]|nr:hypothetical protein FO519_001952 [Halicephalobus sp. NKZ332]
MRNNTTNPLTKSEFFAVHDQLGDVKDFENPKLALEQYMTDRSTVVEFMQLVDRCVGIREKRVLDLGCGTGMLGIAALLCEAEHVSFVDIDPEALEVCKETVANLMEDDESIGESVFFNTSVFDFVPEETPDIIITNPPFGTKNNEHIDLKFVLAALNMIDEEGAIFSFHKRSTSDGLIKNVRKEMPKAHGEPLAHIKWTLPKTYSHQMLESKVIDVSVFCWTLGQHSTSIVHQPHVGKSKKDEKSKAKKRK